MTTSNANPVSARAERDALVSGALNESNVIQRHTGDVGWPTVVLCAALVVSYASVIATYLASLLPLWAGIAINTVLSYAFYTVHHDANHKAISGRNARWKWLDATCGSIAAVPLMLSFKGFSGAHLRHHANTNDPLKDPDALVIGPLWAVPIKWFLSVVLLSVVGALPGGNTLLERALARMRPGAPEPTERAKEENRLVRRYTQFGLIALLASIPLGLFQPAFFLWWLPGRLAGLPLAVLFSWLPHVPFDSTERFHNTRIATFRGSTWLLLQQDRHLIHHLYPSVPWYRYRAVFRELRPLLEAEGARIEGRDTNGRVPITLTIAATSS